MNARALFKAMLCAALVLAPARASAQHDDEQRAIALFKRGEAAYNEGRFQDAADLLVKAYAIKAVPVILYNLGRAYEGLGDLEKASDAYARYLEQDPATTDRKIIEQRIATLRREIEEKKTLQRQRDEERRRAEEDERRARDEAARRASSDREREATRDRERSPSPAPWIVVGVGAAGLGAGAVLGLLSRARHDDAVGDATSSAASSDQGSAKSFATAANIAFVAGGVIAAAGVTLLVVRSSSAARATAWVGVGPGSVAAGGSF